MHVQSTSTPQAYQNKGIEREEKPQLEKKTIDKEN